jgi:ankyrin repeat protein
MIFWNGSLEAMGGSISCVDSSERVEASSVSSARKSSPASSSTPSTQPLNPLEAKGNVDSHVKSSEIANTLSEDVKAVAIGSPAALSLSPQLPSVDSQWRCKHHGLLSHNFFVNYRVNADAQLAETLAMGLASASAHPEYTSPLTAFFDKHCLVVGDGWEQGFLNCIRTADVIVLLVSEAALSGIRNAHLRPDNVLLEYECALDLSSSKSATVFPVLLGSFVSFEGQQLYKKFSAFDTSVYADAPHAHPRSGLNVRQTMKNLFGLQGKFVQPDQLFSVIPDIVQVFKAQWLRKQEEKKQVAMKAQADKASKMKEAMASRAIDVQAPVGRPLEETQNHKLNEQLLSACQNGDEDAVSTLLSSGGVDLLCTGSWGYTPLHVAAYYGHAGVAKLLIEAGADPNVFMPAEALALDIAQEYSQHDVVKVLEPLTAPPAQVADHMLWIAASRGSLEKLIRALSFGGDPNYFNDNYYGYSTLMIAAYEGHVDCVAELIALGADVNLQDEKYYNYTALHFAAYRGHKKCVELLLEKGADATITDTEGCTALEVARTYGQKEVVRVFEVPQETAAQ